MKSVRTTPEFSIVNSVCNIFVFLMYCCVELPFAVGVMLQCPPTL